tara:strand:+ start:307 stop:807 length:501 start_codon:yes stop_codon:yes gene_type:complete
MSYQDIPDISEYDLDKVRFRKGRLFSGMKYYGKNIIIMTPVMNCPFGIEKYFNNLLVKFRFDQNREGHSELFSFVRELESKINQVFGRPAFCSQIRLSTKGDPLLITKIPNPKNAFKIVASNDSIHTLNDVKKNVNLRCVLEINKIWCDEDKCSYKWLLRKVLFCD